MVQLQPACCDCLIKRKRRSGVNEFAKAGGGDGIQLCWRPDRVEFESGGVNSSCHTRREAATLEAAQSAILDHTISAKIEPDKAGGIHIVIFRRRLKLRLG